MEKDKLREIFSVLEKRRDNAQVELENKQAFIASEFPEIKEIDNLITRIGFGVTKSILNKKNNIEKIKEEAIKEINKLSLQKEKILVENGYPKDFLKIKYTCDKCNDTGYAKFYNKKNEVQGSKKCICLEQMIIKKLYNDSFMKDIIETQNFESFDINIFDNTTKEPGMNVTQRENMTILLDTVDSFINNFGIKPIKSMLFYGPPGTGKTFLCSCIAKAVLDKEHTVVYRTAKKTLDTIFEFNANKHKYEVNCEIKQAYDELFLCDLLIIDDLGTEMVSNYSLTELFNLLNERILAKKATIISTNLTLKGIQENYTMRIMSRIFEHYDVYKFFGEDIRMMKFANRMTNYN